MSFGDAKQAVDETVKAIEQGMTCDRRLRNHGYAPVCIGGTSPVKYPSSIGKPSLPERLTGRRPSRPLNPLGANAKYRLSKNFTVRRQLPNKALIPH